MPLTIKNVVLRYLENTMPVKAKKVDIVCITSRLFKGAVHFFGALHLLKGRFGWV